MARICAFVFNPVIRDARVIKQANSLAAAGHHVTIIGLADNNHPEERITLETGVEVRRVPRQDGRALGITGFLKSWLRKARAKHLDLVIVPLVLVYIAIAGFFGPVEERIERIFDLIIYCALAAGIAYLLVNSPRMIRIVLVVIRRIAKGVLGEKTTDRIYGYLLSRARRFAPALFEKEVERRSRYRVDRMVRMAQSISPDIVHCHDVHTLPVGAAIKPLTGCRVIYDAHEIYEEIAQSNPAASRRYRDIHGKYLNCVDGFVTINDSIAGWYKQNYPAIPVPVVVMNATVRAPRFKYDGRLHEAAGLPEDHKILLYQGGYATKRGLEYLVRSAAFLPPEWTLVMMGWGRLEPMLHSIGDEINADLVGKRKNPAVRFLPPVPQRELAYWSAGATIGVIPYENVGLNHWFCTPNKLWEYPNAGVPVLVSPFPELRKPVETYGYGWLLPEEQEPRLLAEQVANLDNKEIAQAKKACAVFSDEENWSKYEVRLLSLYDRIIDAAGIPAVQPLAAASAKSGGKRKRAASKRT